MKVFLKTFGCTLNQADGDAIKACLLKAGHTFIACEDEAELLVVLTCGVKGTTERKILEYLRKLDRQSRGQNKPLVVAGCLPHIALNKVEVSAPNAAILGVNCAPKIAGLVEKISSCETSNSLPNGLRAINLSGEPEEKFSLPRCVEGVIARIPIAYGCVGECSYCCVRRARGHLRSVPLEKIVSQVKNAVSEGAKEIRLTAQDCGCYGLDCNSSIAELLNALDGIEGEFMMRVGMMNPNHVSKKLDEVVEAFRSSKVYKFLHIPVQSGSDEVLDAMKRGYRSKDFKAIVAAFHAEFPEVTLATDVIAGFPSESEEEFMQTLQLIKEVEPDVVNVSQFSPRPGTPAAGMKQLPSQVVKRRSRKLSEACRAIALRKNRALVGRRYCVLVTEAARNAMAARNENYKTVLVESASLGEFLEAEVRSAGVCYLKAF